MSRGPAESSPALVTHWNAPRTELAQWVRAVEAEYRDSGLSAIDAAELLGCTVAELEAVLRLALLQDDTLDQVSAVAPPMTTWLLLSEVSDGEIPAVLEAIRAERNSGSEFQRMSRAIQSISGGSQLSAIQNLEPTLFQFAHKKAAAYEIWPPQSRNLNALKSFAQRRISGKPLTSRQTAYAKGLLKELVDANAIRVPSPDDDDDMCQMILDAVGK